MPGAAWQRCPPGGTEPSRSGDRHLPTSSVASQPGGSGRMDPVAPPPQFLLRLHPADAGRGRAGRVSPSSRDGAAGSWDLPSPPPSDGLPEPNPCGNASRPTSPAGWMENMANCRGLTHAGARAGEARRVPRAGGTGTHTFPHEDAGCCRGAREVAHVALPYPTFPTPTGMPPELLPTLPGQLGKKRAFNLSVLPRGRAGAAGT